MAWKAFLRSVQDSQSVNDSINITVEYQEDISGKSFTKLYGLLVNNYPTLQSVRDFIISERQKLGTFDSVLSILKPYVDKEIT